MRNALLFADPVKSQSGNLRVLFDLQPGIVTHPGKDIQTKDAKRVHKNVCTPGPGTGVGVHFFTAQYGKSDPYGPLAGTFGGCKDLLRSIIRFPNPTS